VVAEAVTRVAPAAMSLLTAVMSTLVTYGAFHQGEDWDKVGAASAVRAEAEVGGEAEAEFEKRTLGATGAMRTEIAMERTRAMLAVARATMVMAMVMSTTRENTVAEAVAEVNPIVAAKMATTTMAAMTAVEARILAMVNVARVETAKMAMVVVTVVNAVMPAVLEIAMVEMMMAKAKMLLAAMVEKAMTTAVGSAEAMLSTNCTEELSTCDVKRDQVPRGQEPSCTP
jgi:hypothetical protein